MLGLSVHLEANLGKTPFAERWQIAKRLGYRGCEFVWRAHDLTEAALLQKETGLVVTCMGGTTGGSGGGARPALVAPEDRERLAEDVQRAITAAKSVGCQRIIMVGGDRVQGWSTDQLRATVIASLRGVAPILEAGGITAVVEPLNSRVDHPSCWMDTSAEAFRVVEAVGSSHVRVLYDLYHMAVMGDDLAATIAQHHDLIGYYHIAGVPGRHEPLGGEVDFHPALDAIAASGYDGFVGLEYGPSIPAEESLTKVRAAYPDRL